MKAVYFYDLETCTFSLTDIPTSVYGEFMRQQVEDRLKFYETGEAPKKNVDVMHEAMQEVTKCYVCTGDRQKNV